MKKIILSFFAFFFLMPLFNAQVQIGSGTIETANVPIEPYYGYSYSQSIYTASEINASGSITGLQWYFSGTSALPSSQNLVIYLAESPKTEFASTADWEPIASFTQVYAGALPSTPGWIQIVFNTPFAYSGTDNLIIAVEENMAGYDQSGDDFYNHTTSLNQSIYYYSDTTNPDPLAPPVALNTTNNRPNVILDGIAQLCPNPGSLTVDTILQDSATVSWTENGSASSWNLEVVPSGTAPSGVATDVATPNPTYTFTGLSPQTDYDFYVQADCGSELSAWIGPMSFTTACSIFTAPYAETFENSGAIPNCWTQGASNGEDWVFATNGGHVGDAGDFAGTTSTSGGYLAYVDDSTPDNLGTTLITPLVDISGLTTPSLYFHTISNNEGNTNVTFSVDFFDGATWHVGVYTSNTNTSGWEQVFIDLSGYTVTGPVQARFIVDENNLSGDFYDDRAIDDVTFDELPSCFNPTAITVDSVTDTTATVSWTDAAGTTSNNIEVVLAGTAPTGVATDVASINPYTITGLTPNTDYEFYIQADCGAGGTTAWVGPFAFSTLCATFTAPYVEDFSTFTVSAAGLVYENCWSATSVGGYVWEVADTNDTSSTGTGPGAGVSSGNYLFTEATSGTTGDFVDLVSPLVDLSALTVPALTIDYHMFGDNMGTLEVIVSDGVTTTTVFSISGQQHLEADPFTTAIVDLGAFAGQTVQATVRAIRGNGFESDMAVDNVGFIEGPACFDPSNVLIDLVSDTEATISWSFATGSTGYNIEVVPAGTAPTGTPTDVATSSPYTITGLTPETDYEFYIQADCSGTTTTWFGPFSFTTLCATFTAPYVEDFSTFTVAATAWDSQNCWSSTYIGGYLWEVADTSDTSSTGTGPGAGVSLGNYLFTEASSGSTGSTIDLITPLVDLSALTTPSFTMDYHMFGGDMGTLQVDVTDGVTTTTIFTITGEQHSETDPFTTVIIDLSSFAGQVVQATIKGIRGAGFESDMAVDNIGFIEAPDCFTPANITVDSTTDTTATISWTDGTGTVSNNIEVVPAGTAPTGTPTDVATSNPYTITGLTPVTDYEFYMQADCGGVGTSTWVGPFAFTTQCAIFTAPYTEPFGNNDAIPNCWTQGASNSENWLFNTPGISHIGNNGDFGGTVSASGGGFAWVDDSSPNSLGTTLVSPLVDVSGLAVPALNFYTISDNEGNTNVSFSVDFFDGAAWNIGVYTSNANTIGWEQVIIDLSGYTITGPVQVRFIVDENNGTDFYDDRAIDDVTFDELPTCFNPTQLTVDATTETSATLSWTDPNGAGSWNIEVVPIGTAPTGTPTVVATSNPFTVNGLTAGTQYDFYLQADCGGGDTSAWVGPVSFATACGIYVAPYLQTFENGTDGPGSIPLCWTQDLANAENWLFSNATSGNHVGDAGDFGGSTTGSNGYYAYVDDSSPNSLATTLLSPLVDISSLTTPTLSFFTISNNEGNTNVDFSVDFFDGANWNVGVYTSNTDVFGWQKIYIDLSGYTITGPVQARFIVDETNGTDFYDDRAIDDVSFDEAPTCFPPTDLYVVSATTSSGEIGWNDPNGASLWNIEYGPSGFTPGTGTLVTGVTNPYNITGLTADTNYDFYVQADCGPVDGPSEWTGPGSFLTGYCPSVPTSNDGQGVDNVEINNINFPSFGDVTYEDHTATVVNMFQGLQIPLFVTFATGFTYGTNIWIDFNDNLIFEPSELVFSGTSTNANPTTLDCTFLLDIAANLGQHRMRIGTADSGQATPNPCYNGSWGVTLDFTVNIQQLTCDLFDASYTVVDDCANGDQFLIEVDVTDLGSATSLTIANNLDATTWAVPSTGVYTVGPFPFMQDVQLITSNDQDPNCTLYSPTFFLLGCPPVNDNCADATVAAVNSDGSCTLVTPGTILGANPSSEPVGTCSGIPNDDVWFQFVATNDSHLISLSNFAGADPTTTNLDFAVYDGTCGTFTELACSDDEFENVGNLTVGNTYYIRVFSGPDSAYTTTFDLCISTAPGLVIPDQTTYTVDQLVTDVLVNSPCATVSNISYSTGSTYDPAEPSGIAYFYRESDGFPFADGVVLVSGDANDITGPASNPWGDSGNWPGDADLFNYITSTGIDPGLSDYNDATVLEFDFVPYNQHISFEFIFASDEYGTFQCSYSDAFAFFLTDMTTNTTTNLAVVPGTTDPISVLTIRDDAYNGGCPSVNEQYFADYYGGGGAAAQFAPINFNGVTVPMVAESDVVPYNTYHIKLVIADRNDHILNSAVFLKAGSFDLGEIDLGGDYLISDGNAACDGTPITIETGAPGYPTVWYKDGFEIPGETSDTLVVSEGGTYAAQIVFSPTCFIYDEIIVEYLPLPEIAATPSNLASCADEQTGTGTYDLTANNATILGPNQNSTDYTITVHPTQQDALDNTNALVSPYTGAAQTVYVRIENNTTGCYNTTTFDLMLYPDPTIVQPSDLQACSDPQGYAMFDLESQTSTVTGGNADYTVTYHESNADAVSGLNALSSPYETIPPQTVYVRAEDVNTGCYSITTFDVLAYPYEDPSFDYGTIDKIPCSESVLAVVYGDLGGVFTLEGDGGTTIDPSTGEIIGGASGASYVVTYTTTGPCPQSSSMTVQFEQCIIPQAISPNGDGLNDSFDLSAFDVQELEIYNRFGALVYSKTNYSNEWHGQSDSGDELPVGTYYYVMRYQGGKEKASWVYINK